MSSVRYAFPSTVSRSQMTKEYESKVKEYDDGEGSDADFGEDEENQAPQAQLSKHQKVSPILDRCFFKSSVEYHQPSPFLFLLFEINIK